MHNADSIAHAKYLRQLRGNEDDRHALFGELHDELMDFGFRSDVHALGGFIEDHDAGMDRKPSGQRDLLLVSAGERSGGAEDRRGLDAQQVYVLPGQIALSFAIDQAPSERRSQEPRDLYS